MGGEQDNEPGTGTWEIGLVQTTQPVMCSAFPLKPILTAADPLQFYLERLFAQTFSYRPYRLNDCSYLQQVMFRSVSPIDNHGVCDSRFMSLSGLSFLICRNPSHCLLGKRQNFLLATVVSPESSQLRTLDTMALT